MKNATVGTKRISNFRIITITIIVTIIIAIITYAVTC
jgi:hypothetical protein